MSTLDNSLDVAEKPLTSSSLTTRLVNRTTLIKKGIWHSVVDLASSHVYSHASAIAFNVLLSFFPFMLLLLIFCRKILQWPAGYDILLELLKNDYLPAGGQAVTNSLRLVAANYTSATFSLIMLLITSSGVFAPIELALNRAWGVTAERKFLASRGLALGLAVVSGLLFMASLFIAANIQDHIRELLGNNLNNSFIRVADMFLIKIVILPITITIFLLIYYFLPNRAVPLKRVLPTAILTAIAWEVLKYIFIWSLPLLNFNSVYGQFYISVSLVMWAFISALVLLLGANLSAQWPD